jgi:hypothetical protein
MDFRNCSHVSLLIKLLNIPANYQYCHWRRYKAQNIKQSFTVSQDNSKSVMVPSWYEEATRRKSLLWETSDKECSFSHNMVQNLLQNNKNIHIPVPILYVSVKQALHCSFTDNRFTTLNQQNEQTCSLDICIISCLTFSIQPLNFLFMLRVRIFLCEGPLNRDACCLHTGS